MLYIRVDANEIIATGHVMRCLAIADAVSEIGGEVTFVTADEKGSTLIMNRGYEAICLNSRWNALEEEIPQLIALIEEKNIAKLLIDTYQVTACYLQTLNEYTNVIYLDDLDAFEYPCSIINYAVYAKECSYGANTEGRHLLGCSYMPLRKMFEDLPVKIVADKIEHILVLTGGTDAYHFGKRFLMEFLDRVSNEKIRNKKLTIICGSFHEDYEELCEIAADYENIFIKKNVSDIQRDMQIADVAISAGGTTLYELCACGTPTISYLLADNQKKNVECFAKMGLIPYCGDIRTENVISRIFEQVQQWDDAKEERTRISKKLQRLVDGKGAKRLAEQLAKCEYRMEKRF